MKNAKLTLSLLLASTLSAHCGAKSAHKDAEDTAKKLGQNDADDKAHKSKHDGKDAADKPGAGDHDKSEQPAGGVRSASSIVSINGRSSAFIVVSLGVAGADIQEATLDGQPLAKSALLAHAVVTKGIVDDAFKTKTFAALTKEDRDQTASDFAGAAYMSLDDIGSALTPASGTSKLTVTLAKDGAVIGSHDFLFEAN